jgi:hypothetical protein
MTHKNDNHQKAKISPELTARLARLAPRQKVRVILVLRTEDTGKDLRQRQSRAEREAAIDAVRKAAEPALIDIDRILERFDGKRLAVDVDALGCIPVETTATGITELAASGRVKAVLEDQSISLLQIPKR